MSAKEEDMNRACAYIERLLPNNFRRTDFYASTCSYEFSPEPGTISRLFAAIERDKYLAGVQEWGLSQTSLDEVFLKIVRETDAEATINN
jgi:hypothetical protein